MAPLVLLAALVAIHVHTTDGRIIPLYPNQIVSLAKPRGENFGVGVNCLVETTNGKFTPAVESCEDIERMIESSQED